MGRLTNHQKLMLKNALTNLIPDLVDWIDNPVGTRFIQPLMPTNDGGSLNMVLEIKGGKNGQ